jgi:dipeptidyl aminopeptidase/acylaminoacyl peptidase
MSNTTWPRPRRVRSHLLIAVVASGTIVRIATGQSAAAAPTGRALAVEDYYRLKTLGAPAMSPDGKSVAFTVSTRIEATNGTTSEVWVVPSDGSAPAHRASPEGTNATGASWTSDNQLRFSTAGDGVTPAGAPAGGRGGGRGARGGARLTSPDGKFVASVRDVPPPKPDRVFESDFAKRHEERFKGVVIDWLNFERDGAPFPTPDQRDPQINPPQEIFVASADGGCPGNPQSGSGGCERRLTQLGLSLSGVEWNADGKTLLFTADSSYRDERSYGRSDIWTASVDGQLRKLTTDRELDYSGAHFSPDGRYILATRETPTDVIIAKHWDHGSATDLVVIPATGGREIVLTADWDYIPSAPMWSPDSKYVYFTGGIGGTTHLFRVPAIGGAVEQITKGERRIAGLSFDRGMTKMAYAVGRFEAPSEISVANIDGSGERQLTTVHKPFTDEVALSATERLQFKSKDGTPIEGWLLFPYGYRANGGPYPLIVSNHGGPHSAVGYGFDFKSQYFAANGYFVLQVNFRSSTGYGEKFLWATWGGWGNKDGEDVMAGIDHVIQRFPIDAKRVATIGHSYGGFMSNWLITQYPDRFAAACVGAGISNWISDYGMADIARTKETEFFGTPWQAEGREIMIRQSPLTYANRVKAATLFIHGEVDHRVPFEEGQQMYFALKKNGVPAKIIQYAGQPHGIAGSWNNVHRMLNERQWLDTYLKH